MGTVINPYFNSRLGVSSEQTLAQNLINECISICGMPAYYIPKTLSTRLDQIFGEDVLVIDNDSNYVLNKILEFVK